MTSEPLALTVNPSFLLNVNEETLDVVELSAVPFVEPTTLSVAGKLTFNSRVSLKLRLLPRVKLAALLSICV